MHTIEPHYNWRNHYTAEDDDRSPFYGREYSEFEYSQRIYNYLIHPQWDNIGSPTLYIKILYVDYLSGHAIVELFGEWNDLINNDIMLLKRDIFEVLMSEGIDKFILIGENVLNFHYSDEEYYAEWVEELPDGWIVGINFAEHVLREMYSARIDSYIQMHPPFDDVDWRPTTPAQLCEVIGRALTLRITS